MDCLQQCKAKTIVYQARRTYLINYEGRYSSKEDDALCMGGLEGNYIFQAAAEKKVWSLTRKFCSLDGILYRTHHTFLIWYNRITICSGLSRIF